MYQKRLASFHFHPTFREHFRESFHKKGSIRGFPSTKPDHVSPLLQISDYPILGTRSGGFKSPVSDAPGVAEPSTDVSVAQSMLVVVVLVVVC